VDPKSRVHISETKGGQGDIFHNLSFANRAEKSAARLHKLSRCLVSTLDAEKVEHKDSATTLPASSLAKLLAPSRALAVHQFWLNKLNQFSGNYEAAEMVKAFIVSGEYRGRFQQ
jgi:hypothetical protein